MNDVQRLIDSHHHLWRLDGRIYYPWLSDQIVGDFFLGDYAAIRRAFLPLQLQGLIPQGYRLLGSVHCEAEADRTQACDETAWVASLSQREGLPCAHVGWAPFGTARCAAWLERQMSSALFRGVRVKPVTAASAAQRDRVNGSTGSLQDANWCAGLTLLEERNLSWDLRVPAWHLADAAKVLEHRPNLRVVLNHCGLPWDRSQAGLGSWRQQMEILAENPNVCVKLSELGVPGKDWNAEQNLRLLCQVIEIFGPQRCLFASNMPVSGLQISYSQWLALIEEAIRIGAPTARDDILWRNACHWYRLDEKRLFIPGL
uniref:amidohydrolase family protein n=1 Tax=Marinobacterium profundum TaxID=1714300 RepID=UPI00083527F1|nr:amidohydrolase family protein [Marinobacterium profundum]